MMDEKTFSKATLHLMTASRISPQYVQYIEGSGGEISMFDSGPIPDYYRFLRLEAHVLSLHPELVLQQAVNQPEGSAAEQDAKHLLEQASPPYFSWGCDLGS